MSRAISNSLRVLAMVALASGSSVAAGHNFDRQQHDRQQNQGQAEGRNNQQNSASQNSQAGNNSQPQRPAGQQRGFVPPPPKLNGPGPHAGDWLRRNRNVPVEQQFRELESDPHYRSLPANQQQQIRQRLQQFNSLSPQQQDRILDGMERREHMPQSERDQESHLYQRYMGMPFQRRQAIRNGLRELRSLSPDEQQRRLSSPEFRSQYSDEEREMLTQALQMGITPGQMRPRGEPPE